MSCWVSLISSENPCGHRVPKLPASSTRVSITRRQRALRRIVAKADASVREETGEGDPALQHIIHGFGDFRVARESGALGAHPNFEGFDKGRNLLLAHGAPAASH